jgi:hypothetical protein
MSLRFVVIEGTTPAQHDRSLLLLEWTHLPARRTGLLFTELAGLLLGRGLQRPRQQTPHRRHSDVFHLCQIHVQPGTLLPPVLAHDDFSPPLRQRLDALEILRGSLACSHVASVQRDVMISLDEILT